MSNSCNGSGPGGSFRSAAADLYATQKDWKKRFDRLLNRDARPMVILAPMHPVMLVYELDSTWGPPLPQTLQEFSRFEGKWDPKRLQRTTENASTHDLIQIEPVTLSSTNSGFATISGARRGMKMRIAIHDKLDEPSRYGVLLHELAHIYLGHLRSDTDGWWPRRGDLDRDAMEVEAEAVAYIVSQRAGLQGSSSRYVSQYITDDFVLRAISLDMIAKVSGRLDEMGTHVLPKRKLKVRARKRGRGERRTEVLALVAPFDLLRDANLVPLTGASGTPLELPAAFLGGIRGCNAKLTRAIGILPLQ